MNDPIDRMYAAALADPQVETWTVAYVDDDGEVSLWFVDMTAEQAGEVEELLEKAQYGDPYVTSRHDPISFDRFMRDSGLGDEDEDLTDYQRDVRESDDAALDQED